MNILMLHPHDIYSNSEPWTVRITYMATEFVRMGHQVRLIYHLLDPRVTLAEATNRQDFPFVSIPAYRHQFALLSKIRSVAEFAKWADIIHFQKCFPHVSVPAIWAAYRLGRPVHYDWDDWEYGIYNFAPGHHLVGKSIDIYEKILPSLCDSVSVSSEELRRMAIARGVPENRIFMAPVGADLARFHPNASGKRVRAEHHLEGQVVLYLGQLHGAQYLELFLKSARILLDRGQKDVNFLIVGGGERFGELFQLAERLSIASKVVFTGAVDHQRIPEYLAAADVCVACFEDTPQIRCKSPLKIAEYMAAGCSIVASQVGEVPNMLGDAGLMVPPGKPEPLAEAVERLLASPQLRAELSRRARVRAETTFNWSATARNILTAYETDLEERRWLFWNSKKKTSDVDKIQPSFGSASKTQIQKPNQDRAIAVKGEGRPSAVPVSIRRNPVKRLRSFISSNLDLVGILDGRHTFIGPHTVQIDPTNRCNNDCIACWCNSPLLTDKAPSGEQKTQALSFSLIVSLLDELAEIGVREIYIAGGGEPFCHPDIKDILRAVKRRGMIANVNTNFTLINEDMVRFLVETGIDFMTVSIWAGAPETYALLHPNKTEETFHQIRRNLTLLNQIKQGAPKTKVYHVLSTLNAHEFLKMVDFARETKSDAVEFTILDTIPDRTDRLLLTKEQQTLLYEQALALVSDPSRAGHVHLFKFDQFLRRISGDQTLSGEHDKNIIDSIPCTVGWCFARVMADGNVNACLKAHRMPVGNLHENSFLKIWNGAKQAEFRNHTLSRKTGDPFFRMIGNDPDAECGCYKSCDDLGRLEYISKRIEALSPLQKAALRIAGIYISARGKNLEARS